MTCENREPDLLLYGLGELPPGRQLATFLHMLLCSRCREKQAQLAAVSKKISKSLRPPHGGPGLAPRPVPHVPVWFALAVLVTLLTLSILTVRFVILHQAAGHSIKQDLGCRPDLPNDKCR